MKAKRILAIVVTLVMVLSVVNVFPNTAITVNAAQYEYVYTDIPNRTVNVEDGIVTLCILGKEYQLNFLPTVADAGCDKEGTCWIMSKDGGISFASYEVQGESLKTYEISIDDSPIYATSLARDSENSVIGYVSGQGNISPLLTLERIRKILCPSTEDTSEDEDEDTTERPSTEDTTEIPSTEDTTGTPSTESPSKSENTTQAPATESPSKIEDKTEAPATESPSKQQTTTKKKAKVKVSKKNITWYDSKGAKVASATLNKGKLKYGKITATKVSDYGFIQKNKVLIFKMKNGNWYTVNMKNKKVMKMSGKIKKLNRDSQKFVVSVTKKNGKKKNVKNLKVTKGKKIRKIKG